MGYPASHEVCLRSNETVFPERQNSLVYRIRERIELVNHYA